MPDLQLAALLKLFAQVSKITDEMLKTQKVRFIFVTFTIKNTKAEFLEDAISAINKGSPRLRTSIAR